MYSSMVGVIMLLAWVCLSIATGQGIFNSLRGIKNHWYLDWTPSNGKRNDDCGHDDNNHKDDERWMLLMMMIMIL